MLTVRAVHPFELLCNPSSPNVWFLWRSLVRDDPSGPDHFASTSLLSIDHLEYRHLFELFLHLLANRFGMLPFLASSTTISSCSNPIPFMALCKQWRCCQRSEKTDIDGPDSLSRKIVSLHPVQLDVLRHGIVCDVAYEFAHESQPLRSLCSA